jgi:hypothetical protein
MKCETKLRIYARLLLALSVFSVVVGVVLANIWCLVSGVISMFLAMWEESDANALHWDEWYQKNKDLIRKQKERAGLV